MVEVLKEINGVATEDITDKDGKARLPEGPAVEHVRPPHRRRQDRLRLLDLHRRRRRDATASSINKAAGRKPADEKDYLAHGWGFAWPANRRILYNRASADLQGKPWSERKKLIWWDAAAPGPGARERRASGSALRRAGLQRVPGAGRQERRQARSSCASDLVGRLLRSAQRRAVPGALRAGGVPDDEPPVEAADEPGGQDLEACPTRRTNWRRWARPTIPTCSPPTASPSITCRASCPATCRCWPSCSTRTSPRSATSWPRSWPIDERREDHRRAPRGARCT